MRATEHFGLKNVAAGTYAVNPDGHGSDYLFGGLYQLEAVATWGGGNLVLNKLGPDGTTELLVITTITANGGQTVYLSPGRYQVVITTATGTSFNLTSVPEN